MKFNRFLEHFICIIIAAFLLRALFFCYPEPVFQHLLYRSQSPLFISDANLFASVYISRGAFFINFFIIYFFFVGIYVIISSAFIHKESFFISSIFYFFLYALIYSFVINEFDLSYVPSYTNQLETSAIWWKIFERGDANSLIEQYMGTLQDLSFYVLIYFRFYFMLREYTQYILKITYDIINNQVQLRFTRKVRYQIIYNWILRIMKLCPLFYFFGGDSVASDFIVFIVIIYFLEVNYFFYRFLIYLNRYQEKINYIAL